jgi:hypothetical protein
LTCALHSRLQHVSMRALDGAGSDRIAASAVVRVLHAFSVVGVVANEAVDRFVRCGLVASTVELDFARGDLRDERIWIAGREQLLAALLATDSRHRAALAAIHRVLDGGSPTISPLMRSRSSTGITPVAHGTVAEPDDCTAVIDVLDVESFFQHPS